MKINCLLNRLYQRRSINNNIKSTLRTALQLFLVSLTQASSCLNNDDRDMLAQAESRPQDYLEKFKKRKMLWQFASDAN